MGVKLEKLTLPSDSDIAILTPEQLVALAIKWRERLEIYQGLLFRVRRNLFGSKSEKSKKPAESTTPAAAPTPVPRGETTKLPSERYPEATVEVDHIDFDTPQPCPACGTNLQDSGMSEKSEYLTVESKVFKIVEQKRHKHRCQKCHGAIITAPSPPRIIHGGSYSDELIVDATLSKYCDLIPMERYCQMAARSGFPGLPPHSLIQASFKLANFLLHVYQLIKTETLATDVLMADETPHRMLEGDAKKRWYLWGFSSDSACFFECHDTRSGDVSTEVLQISNCQVLVSDVYSGYKKSVKEANQLRLAKGKAQIQNAYCNAHARRAFIIGEQDDKENISLDAKYMVDQYKYIYRLEAETRKLSDDEILEKRAQMKQIFEAMRNEALQKINIYSSKSQMGSAYSYFLKNYDGLIIFLSHPKVPIDNNSSERLLRNHVIGRKTWYGTHSKAGAATAAAHFTIVNTCKMNKVNPRQYYLEMIRRIHNKQEILTPHQYQQQRPPDSC